MQHQNDFRCKTLPHYLNVIRSVVSLADIVISACGEKLSVTEKTRLITEVGAAHTAINKAVSEGKEIRSDVDSEITEIPFEHKELQEAIDSVSRELQHVEKELISQEILKEKCRDKIQRTQAKLLQAEATQNKANAQKAEKETARNVGIGLLLIPFIGIPLILGASKEIERIQLLIDFTSEVKGSLSVKRDKQKQELKQCYLKITELRIKQAQHENLREKERKVIMMKKQSDELFDAQRKVKQHLSFLSKIQCKVEVLRNQCTEETFYGMSGIKDRLQDIFTFIQLEGFEKELLWDTRVCTRLTELDNKIPKFNSIYFNSSQIQNGD
ncbi:uncharacterized protein [Heptranchias perlo]|uniref:uncharacterized protein n=1 Tax=Heptranchias perlo TaxID=212740 RepID=UPI00355A1244